MLPAEKNFAQGWITREESETDWDYGKRPEHRTVQEKLENGIILIDKPAGPKSHKISVGIKKKLNLRKAGHSGTLDPGVTGVLPVGINKGTKVLDALKNAGKEYICLMELSKEFDSDEIEKVAESFVGTVKQIPPEISAVKREEREREVYGVDIKEVDGRSVLLRIESEKGFYVRTFCRQFGDRIGADGEMAELRRTKVGLFEEDDCNPLDKVYNEFSKFSERKENRMDSILLPVEAGVKHMKKILVKDSAIAALCHGADLGTVGISKLQEGIVEGEKVALLSLKGELVALGKALITSEEMAENKDTAVDLSRVFMSKDIYPKKW